MGKQQVSFYPCFNGIRVGTRVMKIENKSIVESFYPCFNGIRVGTKQWTLNG